MVQYDWKRFWCPRHKSASVSETGYLQDPDGTYGAVLNPHAKPLDKYTQVPCLVMVGEPGIGKSTEFMLAFDQAKAQFDASNDAAILIDFRQIGDQNQLNSELFESPTFRAWKAGTHTLNGSSD